MFKTTDCLLEIQCRTDVNYDLSEKSDRGDLKGDLKHIFVAILTGKHTKQASQSLKNIKESSLSEKVAYENHR